MKFIHPYVLIGVLLALGGAFWYGTKVGSDAEVARVARDNQIIETVFDRAQQGAAKAIAENKPRHTTIQQKTQEVIREVPVYRDCVNDAAVVGLLDAARANRAAP